MALPFPTGMTATAIAKTPFYCGITKFADIGDVVTVTICDYSTNLINISNPAMPGFCHVMERPSAAEKASLLYVPVVDVVELVE